MPVYYYPGFSPGNQVAHSAFEGETIVDKMPCLGAYAPSGIQTHDPLITSQEHEPLHHSAPQILIQLPEDYSDQVTI